MRPADLQFAALAAAYDAGLDPMELTRSLLDAIAEGDPTFILVTRTRALAQATALDPARRAEQPLWGVPFTVKDNIDVAGLPTTAGCPGFAYTPAASATVVARLEAAGAILIGKTNLDQFATGLVGTRSPYGTPVNPLLADRVPGGSSSGSAVAVSRGLVAFSLGTDTAGSGRIPAGFCNIVGLKPTRGVIPTTGVVPACRSIDCVSVFAGSVADAYVVLTVVAGPDGIDGFARRDGAAVAVPVRCQPPHLRIGVPRATDLLADADWHAGFRAATEALEAAGHRLVPIDVTPLLAAAELLYTGPWVAERTAAVGAAVSSGIAGLDPVVTAIIRSGERFSAVDAHQGRYQLAGLSLAAQALWQQIDCLVVPTAPHHPTLAAIAADPVGANAALGRYTNFVNLLDMAALAIPGPKVDGRPTGVTVIGAALSDPLLAAVGQVLHHALAHDVGATGYPLVPFGDRVPRPSPGRIPIAVVGAHLSGLPLNPQLTHVGGRLLWVGTTAPCYRLYALDGFQPPRPGMVRVADGGAAIALEVWDLPAAAFGEFVAAIPAPLGIGKVTLSDGTEVPGFLCEPTALAGGRDITHFGGWRAANA